MALRFSNPRSVAEGAELPRNKIDDIDRKILRALQENGRASTREIAEKLGKLSKVAVSYRIRRLKRCGVLEGFYAKVNSQKLGRGFLFVTSLVLVNKGPASTRTIQKIAALKGVQSIYLTFGDFDAVVIARTSDAIAARDLVYRMFRTGGVQSSRTLIVHTLVKESLEVDI
jgi:DNA-binding Lrp family transcriptional regulator